VANVAPTSQQAPHPTTDVATPVSLTTLWSKTESELKLELLNEKRNKKDEATNRLRNELKHLNSEYDYSFADEEMSNHNEIIVKIRSEMENIKNKLETIHVSGESQGVVVRANGNRKVLSISVPAEIVGDKEMIEELILTATNRALAEAEKVNEREMQSAAMGIMPGLM
jgi:DNA-binding YbaB/EbfC family protein